MIRIRPRYQLPEDKQDELRKAKKLEWATIVYALVAAYILYLLAGESQAMRAEYLEHLLEVVPPVAFFIAMHVRTKRPNERFPYGYRRIISVAFVLASMALFGLGLFILYEALTSLLRQEHPTIGTYEIFGWHLWAGWVMIAALVASATTAMVLGHFKLPLARELREKVLRADAEMNKADWLSSGAAVLGILGIGIGWWWADAVAALIIGLDILWDGWMNMRSAIADLMDKIPTTVETQEKEPVIERLQRELERLEWVAEAAVRLREEGDVLTGEVYVVPKKGSDLVHNIQETYHWIDNFDWRFYDVVIMPVPSLNREEGKDEEALF